MSTKLESRDRPTQAHAATKSDAIREFHVSVPESELTELRRRILALIEAGGFRLLTDPTFDAPGEYKLPHVTLKETYRAAQTRRVDNDSAAA